MMSQTTSADRDVLSTSLAAIHMARKQGAEPELVEAAIFACDKARAAIADVPPRGVTPSQIARYRSARNACRRARIAIAKALNVLDSDSDQVLRSALAVWWKALETDLLVREKERELADIEGRAFPRLMLVAV